MKKTFSILLAALILMVSIAPAFAVNYKNVKNGQTLYVNTSGANLRMRDYPSAKGNVIYSLPNGTPVTASRQYENGFLMVKYSVGSVHEEGWVDIKYLSTTRGGSNNNSGSSAQKETVASLNFKSYKLIPEGTTYVVSSKPSRAGGFVNLRWVPSMDSAVIERMYLGEEMTVIAEGSKWLQVRCKDGYVGYIVKSYTNDVFRGNTADWEAMQAAQ